MKIWIRHCFILATGITFICLIAPESSAGKGKDAVSRVITERIVMDTTELHKSEPPSETSEEAEAPSTESVQLTPADIEYEIYRIGPGDSLFFRSFDDESLSTEVVVRYDGHISLPLIPDVDVSGSTRDEATKLVREAYGAFYSEPLVSLSIRQAGSRTYTVIGEVNQPSEYTYTRPISLLDTITLAGGLRTNRSGGDSFVGSQGQLVKAYIIRIRNGEREVNEYDLRALRDQGPHPSQTPVLPGDIVYVPEGVNLVYILGESRRSDVFALRQGMTLLQLLADAGGFNEDTARLRKVILMREISATETEILHINIRQIFKTGFDPKLQAGDIIYVPRKPLVNAQAFVQRFTGTVSPILSLYSQSIDVIYSKKRIEQFLDGSGGGNSLLGIINALTGLGTAF